MTINSLNINNPQFGLLLIFDEIECGFFIAFTLLVIVRTICLFHSFEKLSILLGFSRDVLEGGRGFIAYTYF